MLHCLYSYPIEQLCDTIKNRWKTKNYYSENDYVYAENKFRIP